MTTFGSQEDTVRIRT